MREQFQRYLKLGMVALSVAFHLSVGYAQDELIEPDQVDLEEAPLPEPDRPPKKSHPLNSADKKSVKNSKKNPPIPTFQFGLHAQTLVPVLMGVGLDGVFVGKVQLFGEYAFVPSFYASTLGSVASSIGGNPAYKDLMEAALQSNSIVRVGAQYAFKGLIGLRLGLAMGMWTTSGKGEIDKVIEAATGKSYPNIKSILIAAGRSTKVNVSGTLTTLDVTGGYAWELTKGLYLQATGGVAFVVAANTHLSTELPNLDSTAQGSSFLRNSEADLNTILKANGILPMAGASLAYFF